MVKPKFTTDGAVVREGPDEFTLRAQEEGAVRSFIDVTNVGDKRWGPSLVDDDWLAICQAIYKGVEGPEWEAMYCQYKELHQAAKSKNFIEKRKGQGTVVWALKEAEDRGIDFYDLGNVKKIHTRIRSTVVSLGNPFEKPVRRAGESLGMS